MLHDNYLSLVESNRQQIKEVRSKTHTRKQRQFLSESKLVLCTAPASLSLYSQVKFIFSKRFIRYTLEGTAKDHYVIFESAVPLNMLQNTAQKET